VVTLVGVAQQGGEPFGKDAAAAAAPLIQPRLVAAAAAHRAAGSRVSAVRAHRLWYVKVGQQPPALAAAGTAAFSGHQRAIAAPTDRPIGSPHDGPADMAAADALNVTYAAAGLAPLSTCALPAAWSQPRARVALDGRALPTR
jgi:hypothetical protein